MSRQAFPCDSKFYVISSLYFLVSEGPLAHANCIQFDLIRRIAPNSLSTIRVHFFFCLIRVISTPSSL